MHSLLIYVVNQLELGVELLVPQLAGLRISGRQLGSSKLLLKLRWGLVSSETLTCTAMGYLDYGGFL